MNGKTIKEKSQNLVNKIRTNRDKMYMQRGRQELLQELFKASSLSTQKILIEGECPGQTRLELEKWKGMTTREKTESFISLIQKFKFYV